jgi:hypothetical protein
MRRTRESGRPNRLTSLSTQAPSAGREARRSTGNAGEDRDAVLRLRAVDQSRVRGAPLGAYRSVPNFHAQPAGVRRRIGCRRPRSRAAADAIGDMGQDISIDHIVERHVGGAVLPPQPYRILKRAGEDAP